MYIFNNLHFFQGHVGKTKSKRLKEKSRMVTVSLAIKRAVKKDDEWTNETMWVYLVAFGNVAERIKKYVKVGCKLSVQCDYTIKHKEDDDGKRLSFHSFRIQDFSIDSWPQKDDDDDDDYDEGDDNDEDYDDDDNDDDDDKDDVDDEDQENERPF